MPPRSAPLPGPALVTKKLMSFADCACAAPHTRARAMNAYFISILLGVGTRRTSLPCGLIPSDSEIVVELRRAGIPFLGWIAAHYWFVVRDGARCDRWEIWQTPDAGGRSVGHLH